MNNDINSILKDLYMIDPSLKDMEGDLKKLIEKLMEAKPDIQVDKAFVKKLRKQLMEEMPAEHEPGWLSRMIFPFAGGVLATGLIVAVILSTSSNVNFNLPGSQKKEAEIAMDTQPATLSMTEKVDQLDEQAFGSLSELTSGGGEVTFDTQAATSSRAGIGAGGGGMATMEAPLPEGAEIKTMPMPPDYRPVTYKYVYKGQAIELPGATVNVYKRVTSGPATSRLVSLMRDLDMGILDLDSFRDMNVESIQLTEDRDEAYRISVNFNESSISLYQDWPRWDQPKEPRQFTPADVPSDEKLIAISDEFLKDHGVNRENYGTPFINKYWEQRIEAVTLSGEAGGAEVFVPNTITLIYPLLIDGKEAIDQGGNPTGLNVGISLYHNKVVSLNNLRVEQFESSAYEAVSEWQTVSDYLAGGASRYPAPENATIKEFEVGEPEIVLMSFWNPAAKGEIHEQYYLPAIQFTVLPNPDSSIYPQKILVPLAKELLKEQSS